MFNSGGVSIKIVSKSSRTRCNSSDTRIEYNRLDVYRASQAAVQQI